MLYEFECMSCGEVIEIQCKIAERPTELKCEKCGGVAKKIMSCPSKPKPIYYMTDLTGKDVHTHED